ncbi:MAG TPA: CDP-alcohol phosphatidyltransferase family protein [Alphaproteobacteria bacterium]|nr:CDP-alcohol phosphatidyltransferase family protein [Alphaproteobacteria bacterium]
MASLYDWKPAFQQKLRPYAERLHERGVTPNQVTLTALGLCAFEGALLLGWPGAWLPLLMLPAVLFVRLALNAIDGMIAREHAQETKSGKILNELGDVLADGFLYLPLMAVPSAPETLIGLAVLAGVAAEFAGVLAEAMGGERRYDGPFGKSERAAAFGAAGLLLALGAEAGWWFDLLMLAVIALSARTAWNRADAAVRPPL